MKDKITVFAHTIGKFLLLITLWTLSIVIAYNLTPIIEKQGKPVSTFYFEFIPFLGLIVGHFVLTKYFEKSNLSYARISKVNFLGNFLKGFSIGLLWLTVSVIPIFILGQGTLNINFSLTIFELLVYFSILFINSGMQELLIHGYLLSVLQEKYSMIVALVTTSLLFLLLHPGAINSGLIASLNVFGAGLIFGLMTIKFNSLFSATLAHSVWNYFGAVWLGLIPLDNYPSMKLISLNGNPLIVGDKNGIETSIIVTVTMMIFVAYLWKIQTTKNKSFDIEAA